ncbi:MAG: dihydroorotase [Candidatus Helarchaeota archaeon]
MTNDYRRAPCDLNLINCKIVLRNRIFEGGLSINNSKIIKIGKVSNLIKSNKIIDIKNKFIIPGLIDTHVHCRDMELSYKEDYYTATAAAIHGGITTILDMPNTKPPTISVQTLKNKVKVAEKKILCNVGFYSGIPKDFSELDEMKKIGIFGIKLLLNNPITNYNYNDINSFKKLINKCSEKGITILIHPEFKKYVDEKSKTIKNNNDISFFLKIHDNTNEYRTIDTIINSCKEINGHIHFCHLSISDDIDLLTKYKNSGNIMKISSEVTPHHLFLSDKDLYEKGTYAKMLPPLRPSPNQENLLKALKSGIIDVIGTDHAPHSIKEKKLNFLDAPSGIPQLETVLPIFLTKINQNEFDIFNLCRSFAENPAKLFNIKNKGVISEGYDADLVIIDLKSEYKINSDRFFSKAKFSPFDGMKCIGKPIMSINNGQIVMKEDEILIKPGNGNVLLNK